MNDLFRKLTLPAEGIYQLMIMGIISGTNRIGLLVRNLIVFPGFHQDNFRIKPFLKSLTPVHTRIEQQNGACWVLSSGQVFRCGHFPYRSEVKWAWFRFRRLKHPHGKIDHTNQYLSGFIQYIDMVFSNPSLLGRFGTGSMGIAAHGQRFESNQRFQGERHMGPLGRISILDADHGLQCTVHQGRMKNIVVKTRLKRFW